MRAASFRWYSAIMIAGLLAGGLALATCSPDSDTGLWIRIVSPDVAIDRAVLEIYDATSPSTTPLGEGEVTLPEAKKFSPSPNEPPEDQLWVLIFANPRQTERVRIYGSGHREGIDRKIAEGFLDGVAFTRNKIADHPVPLELTHSGSDDDEDGFYVPDDCDDTRPEVNPDADEICDGLDNNCDGTNDEGCDCTPGEQQECWPHWAEPIACEVGTQACPCQTGTQNCPDGLWGLCENLVAPDQEGGPQPCADDTYDCYPTCSDGIDNDCSGSLDDRDPACGGCEPGSDRSCYNGPPETENVGLCRSGRQYCIDGSFGPCEGEVLPAEKETCDGHDNDCDTLTDEFERDEMPMCGNNVGVCELARKACIEQGGEYIWEDCSTQDYQDFAAELLCGVPDPPDCCPDSCFQVPETVAFCDNLDNDCDGRVDNATDGVCSCSPNGATRPYSLDEGECVEGTEVCENGEWVIQTPGVLPVPELCDNLDNDCDTVTDQNADAEEDCRINHPRDNMHVLGCSAGICLRACDSDPPNYCWGNCDATDDNGCETALNTLQNCTTCGTACSRANATATCATCTCRIASCDSLWGDCDGNDGTGCETPLNTLDDCGQCNGICWRAHATPTCATGNCRIQSCNSLWDDCDGVDLNGCETSLETTSDCGSCGTTCSRPNASATCSGGNCRIASCNNLWANCDGSDGNGCETSLQTLQNCGSCGSVCTRAHASETCSGGDCRIDTCDSGWGNCDGSDGNGCETPLNTLQNCGGCGSTCTRAHATATCSTGSCRISSCDSLWDDCDGNDANGCEQSLETLAHCGSCNTTCARAHATATCSGGNCRIASCQSLWGNCDANDANGCETSLQTLTNCGSCGTGCSRTNATASCTGGSCHIDSCDPGWGDCDGSDGNGCETRLNTLQHCGACNTPCSRANASATCSTGSCLILSCNSPYENCDGVDSNGCERNLNNDAENCGSCGNDCGQNAFCSTGSCSCNPGYANCDGSWNNGCEININTDANNCGGCGNDCNQNAYCSSGSCACDTGYRNCDGNWNTGCEIDIRTDPLNCGNCGNSCGANATCSSSSCTCTGTYENCDTNWGNGCEADLADDPLNCGSCGFSCGQNADCISSTCECDFGFGNCSGGWADGCETVLNTTSNCGSCGNTCGPDSDKACILGMPIHCGCNDIGDCDTGEYCPTSICAACDVPAACGTSCTDCAGQNYDQACYNDGGTLRCGCNDGNDCGPPRQDCNTDSHYCE